MTFKAVQARLLDRNPSMGRAEIRMMNSEFWRLLEYVYGRGEQEGLNEAERAAGKDMGMPDFLKGMFR